MGIDTTPVYGFIGVLMTVIIYALLYIAAAKSTFIGIAVGTSWILVSSLIGWFPLTPEIRASLVALVLVIGAVIGR